MSALTTQFPYTHTSVIPLDPSTPLTPRQALDTAISVIHHHPSMCHLNPVLTKVVPLDPPPSPAPVDIAKLSTLFDLTDSSSPWSFYELHDELPLLFGAYTHHLVYHAAIRNLKDGMESLVQAPSNVVIHAVWDASIQLRRKMDLKIGEPDDGEMCLVLTEKSEIRCGRHLGWYIKSTLEKTHGEMHDGLKKIWKGTLGIKDPTDDGIGKAEKISKAGSAPQTPNALSTPNSDR